MILKRFAFLALLPLLFLWVSAAMAAPPQPPNIFEGAVSFDGAAAPDGTIVTALVTHSPTETVSVTTTTFANGFYSINAPADDSDTPVYDGGINNDAVEFLIAGYGAVQTATFQSSNVTPLNLSAQSSFSVTTVVDEVNGNYSFGDYSLREAIANATAGGNVTFDASLSGKTITLTLGQLSIDKSLTIHGNVPITVSGNNTHRVVEIMSNQTVTLSALTLVDGNAGGNDGGGIYLNPSSTLLLTDSLVSENQAASGGGIYSDGAAFTISDSSIISNTAATSHGGGLFNDVGSGWVDNSTFANNVAQVHAGAIWNRGVLTVTQGSFLANSAASRGGAVFNFAPLTVRDSMFNSNSAAVGGGIFSREDMLITSTTFLSNTATSTGGAIKNNGPAVIQQSTLSGNMASTGGAIHNADFMTVSQTTIAGNVSTLTGGGIFSSGTLAVRNSTLSANSAATGGAIRNNGVASVEHSTLFGNMATTGGGIQALSALTLYHTIVDSNGSNNCDGLISSTGNNIDSGVTCGLSASSDQSNVDPLLGPLADNGGATQTHLPDNSSVAIDAGVQDCVIAVDQREKARADLACDIGATETSLADNDTVIKEVADGTMETYGPTYVTIARNGGADPGLITVTKKYTETGNPGTFDIVWQISAETITGLNLDLTICYADNEIPDPLGPLEDSFVIFRQPSGGVFAPLTTTVDAVTNCLTATLTGFSNFVIGTGAPNATSVSAFSASAPMTDTVTLSWETSSETGLAGFNVYRRLAGSGLDWIKVNATLVTATGTSEAGSSYQFVETDVPNNRWDYLLENVESNGDTARHWADVVMLVVGSPTAVRLLQPQVATDPAVILSMFVTGLISMTGVLMTRYRKPIG